MRKRISKYKHLHSNRFRYLSSSIPLICASGLLLVGGMMINPISSINRLGVDGEVYASVTTGGAATGGSGDETSDSTTTPSIVMGIDNSDTTLLGQVNSTSTPGSITRNMTITASNVDKYAVYVQSNDSNNGQLVGQASGGRVGQITSTDGVVLSSIPDNTWGYALAEGENLTADNANLKYKAVSSSADATNPAYSTTTPEGTKKFTLAFGVKFGDSANPDHYKADVLVSVAANPGEVTETLGFGGVTTMQELTPEICGKVPTDTEGRLMDIRDNKSYWVAKLRDGNCWMTQNLDLDLSTPDSSSTTARVLTKDDSNVSANWAAGYNRTGAQNQLSGWVTTSSDDTLTQWYDPGEWVYTNNTNEQTTACGVYNNAIASFVPCEQYGWKKVEIPANPEADLTWTATTDTKFINASSYVGTDGVTTCSKKAGSYFGESTDAVACRMYYGDYARLITESLGLKDDFRHYAIGNYYSLYTATAGSASKASTAPNYGMNYSADASICPLNWRLPVTAGDDNEALMANGTYLRLFTSYGWDFGDSTTLMVENMNGGTQYNLFEKPFYYLFGGLVGGAGLYDVNTRGSYWSATMQSSTAGKHLTFITGRGTWLANATTSPGGFNVRCMVKNPI